MEIENTSLWSNSLAPREDRYEKVRSFFRNKFLDVRKKVAPLVSLIPKDIPGLTVHDITHLDALWETASMVAGEGYTINPIEAYVFGCSVLLHDAGMTLAAYRHGVDDLYQTVEWQDTLASYLRESGVEYSPAVNEKLPDDLKRRVIGIVLRALHAKQSAQLPLIPWPIPGQHGEEYLIDDVDLRTFYGTIIGKIAYSHWCSVNQLEGLLPTIIGALPSAPKEWTLDAVKIACLLRVADVTHLDERRAPRFLLTLLRPTGVSAIHWNFQSKLTKPRLEGDAIVYTSGPEFTVEDADAWWLCYDSVREADTQLHETDVLLEASTRPRFEARRVKGAESPESLASFVRTHNWRPVDASVKVTDVPSLVQMLGGRRLYGDNQSIAVRELIQNAADAIRARRIVDGRDEGYGRINVRLIEKNKEIWLVVEDDGIGMSVAVLTGALLDFGKSFWSGDDVKVEFPGLLSKGMKPTGRFGIGFFSIFMLGDTVHVTSRRFDAAPDKTRVLEFRGGLAVRPILREAAVGEHLRDGGTKISVKLHTHPYSPKGLLANGDYKISLSRRVGNISPCVDVQIATEEFGKTEVTIRNQDWRTLNAVNFLQRLELADFDSHTGSYGSEIKKYSGCLRLITDGNVVFGRACIFPPYRFSVAGGIVTAGGLNSAKMNFIHGVLLGEVETAARDSAMPNVPAAVLSEWADEQAALISTMDLPDDEKMRACGIVLACGGSPSDLPVGVRGDEYFSIVQLRTMLRGLREFRVYWKEEVDYDEDEDSCHPKDFREDFEADSNIFFVSDFQPNIYSVGSRKWPQCLSSPADNRKLKLEDLVRSEIGNVWKGQFTEEISHEIVGSVGTADISRRITIFTAT